MLRKIFRLQGFYSAKVVCETQTAGRRWHHRTLTSTNRKLLFYRLRFDLTFAADLEPSRKSVALLDSIFSERGSK